MAKEVDGLEEAFLSADMGSWEKMMQGATAVQPVKPTIDDSLYSAVFSTEAGRAVLADMYARYVNVTIVEPGRSPETHGIRQGQANVVFDIVDRMTKAMGEAENDG
jgi:hypothetical protein